MVNKTAGMHTLEKDGVVVLFQPLQQFGMPSRLHDERPEADLMPKGPRAGVIIDLVAIFVKLGVWLAVVVLETVQNDLHARLVQSLDLVENHDHAAIIGRVWDIKGDYVQKHKRFKVCLSGQR